MAERERAGRPQRYCPNCSNEVRAGNAFCVSCGERLDVEGGTRPVVRGSGSRNRSPLNQGDKKVALYGAGLLLLLVVAYLFLSYSMPLGFLLIGLSVLAVLVIRKNKGRQTRLEQRVFESVGRYRGSAQKAYEDGKHREFAQKAYLQSKKVYGEASTRYRRWSERQAAERERNEPQSNAASDQPPRPPRASPGSAAGVSSGFPLVSAYPPQECMDRAEAFMIVNGYSVERGGSTATFARERPINWLAFCVFFLFGLLPGVLYLVALALSPVRTTLVTMPSGTGTELAVQSEDGEDAAVLEGWIRSNLCLPDSHDSGKCSGSEPS